MSKNDEESNRPLEDSPLTEDERSRVLSTWRLQLVLSAFIAIVVVGLSAMIVVLVQSIFDQSVPAVRRDLSWIAQRGARELARSAEFGVVLGDEQLVQATFTDFVAHADIQTLVAHGESGIVAQSGPDIDGAPDRETMEPGVVVELPSGFYAWAPVEIEGARVGTVEILVSNGRLLAIETFRDRVLGIAFIGCILALLLASVFVRFYLKPILDVTADAFRRLETATQRALESARLKSEFLANMSHEIRTPMNGVLGMIELLKRTELSAQQDRYVTTTHRSAEALMVLLNDILDFSKIEAGKLQIHQVSFDVRSVVEDVASLLAGRAHNAGLEFVCAISPGVPPSVLGDPDRLRQVLLNLGGNAVKFTEEGLIRIRVTKTSDGERLRFEVSDTGIGIAPEHLDRVFHAFEQADGTLTRRAGGTGLGLAISQSLVKAMGGAIQLSSKLGEGSTFAFELPLTPGEDLSGMRVEVPKLDGKTVLIATRSRAVAEAVAELMAPTGAATELVDSEDSLYDALEKHGAGNSRHVDLAIVDNEFEAEDALSMVDILRGVESVRHTMLMVRAGAPRHQGITAIHKPVRQADLLWAIRRELLGEESLRIERQSSRPSNRRRGHLLIAEDNPINQQVIFELVEGFGYTAELADDGAAAFHRALSGEFNGVLMDCQMPVMDGYTATEKIRAAEAARGDGVRIPIIAVTAHAYEAERQHALAVGMDDYVTKPIGAGHLAAVLSKWIDDAAERSGGRVLPVRREAGPGVVSESEATPGRRQAKPSAEVDVDPETLPVLDENTKRSDKVLGLFHEHIPAQLRDLSGALEAQDLEAFGQFAHRLKGSALSIGARRLAGHAKHAERATDLDTARVLEARIRECADAALAELPRPSR